jgi:hypothetical protein
MRGRLSGSVAIFLLGLLAVGGGIASAQDKGVHVDPNSPAGKEYALPLDSARREASGGASSGSSSGDSAPLFGAGISRGGGSSGGGASSPGSGPGDGKANGTRDGGSGGSGGNGSSLGGVDATQAARAVADTGGGLSAGALTLLIALGVLAVGGLIGLSVRALRSGHPSA